MIKQAKGCLGLSLIASKLSNVIQYSYVYTARVINFVRVICDHMHWLYDISCYVDSINITSGWSVKVSVENFAVIYCLLFWGEP